MDKIDWSKAPEGAKYAAWRKTTDKPMICWYRIVDGGWHYWYEEDSGPWRSCSDGSPAHKPLIPRPQPDNKEGEGVEWDGEGLPPVGVVCRANWLVPPDGGDMKPIPVKIVAYDNGQHNVWLKTAYGDELLPVRDCLFEVKKSHRDKVIEAAVKNHNIKRSYRESMEHLYDLGMLKLPGDEQ